LNLKVVDTNSLKFIPADRAYYVVGSSKPATMSKTSKYAFAKKSDAQAFVKKYGGKIMKFYDAYDIAIKDFKK
jgi:nitrous oxide reductase accessory protein NosL